MSALYTQRTGPYAHAAALSRRRFVRTSGAAALVAMGGMPVSTAAATAADSLPRGIAEWAAGWEGLDAARFASGFTEDGVLEAVALGQVVQGRAEIQANAQTLLDAFSEITARMPTIIMAGDQAAAEWTFAGRYTGQLPGLPPGEGQDFSFRGVSIVALEDGLIRHNSRYFDLFGMLVQAGAAEPPTAPADDASSEYDPNYEEIAAVTRVG